MTRNKRAEIDRIAKILMDAWAKAEPNHNVTKYPVSYMATFVDMARAIVEDKHNPVVEDKHNPRTCTSPTCDYRACK